MGRPALRGLLAAAVAGAGLAQTCQYTATSPATPGPFFQDQCVAEGTNMLRWCDSSFRVMLQGRVFGIGPGCSRVRVAAAVDLWHADPAGNYDPHTDLSSTRCRGRVRANADGVFSFSTSRPGVYGCRAPHFHVRVRAQGWRTLTTQLYFENATFGGWGPTSRDCCTCGFRPELVLPITSWPPSEQTVQHDFYLVPGAGSIAPSWNRSLCGPNLGASSTSTSATATALSASSGMTSTSRTTVSSVHTSTVRTTISTTLSSAENSAISGYGQGGVNGFQNQSTSDDAQSSTSSSGQSTDSATLVAIAGSIGVAIVAVLLALYCKQRRKHQHESAQVEWIGGGIHPAAPAEVSDAQTDRSEGERDSSLHEVTFKPFSEI